MVVWSGRGHRPVSVEIPGHESATPMEMKSNSAYSNPGLRTDTMTHPGVYVGHKRRKLEKKMEAM